MLDSLVQTRLFTLNYRPPPYTLHSWNIANLTNYKVKCFLKNNLKEYDNSRGFSILNNALPGLSEIQFVGQLKLICIQ